EEKRQHAHVAMEELRDRGERPGQLHNLTVQLKTVGLAPKKSDRGGKFQKWQRWRVDPLVRGWPPGQPLRGEQSWRLARGPAADQGVHPPGYPDPSCLSFVLNGKCHKAQGKSGSIFCSPNKDWPNRAK